MLFPCLGQENERARRDREKKIGHNEDMRGSCMETDSRTGALAPSK